MTDSNVQNKNNNKKQKSVFFLYYAASAVIGSFAGGTLNRGLSRDKATAEHEAEELARKFVCEEVGSTFQPRDFKYPRWRGAKAGILGSMVGGFLGYAFARFTALGAPAETSSHNSNHYHWLPKRNLANKPKL